MAILVTVIDREILVENFETFPEAYEKMKNEFFEAYDGQGEINNVSAWVNRQKGIAYDWAIIWV